MVSQANQPFVGDIVHPYQQFLELGCSSAQQYGSRVTQVVAILVRRSLHKLSSVRRGNWLPMILPPSSAIWLFFKLSFLILRAKGALVRICRPSMVIAALVSSSSNLLRRLSSSKFGRFSVNNLNVLGFIRISACLQTVTEGSVSSSCSSSAIYIHFVKVFAVIPVLSMNVPRRTLVNFFRDSITASIDFSDSLLPRRSRYSRFVRCVMVLRWSSSIPQLTSLRYFMKRGCLMDSQV